jgi:hypothetical protein
MLCWREGSVAPRPQPGLCCCFAGTVSPAALFVYLVVAPFLGVLLIIIILNFAAAVIYVLWRRAFLPAAKGVEQHGIVGVSKAICQRFLVPILYGKGAKTGK